MTGRCSAITSPAGAGHDHPAHPECNARLLTALSGVPPGTLFRTPEPADEKDVHRVHTPHYTAWLRQRCAAAVVPGFVDSHTHLVFAGERSAEFSARMAGDW